MGQRAEKGILKTTLSGRKEGGRAVWNGLIFVHGRGGSRGQNWHHIFGIGRGGGR